MPDPGVTLHHGDCLDVLRTLPAASAHAVITDPPYELGFMGRAWDAQGIAYRTDLWAECLRILTPGGHLLAFGGTRTSHRMVCAVEDAGFEIRDAITWLYASGFPKSLDVSKAIDRAAGAERRIVADKLDRPGYHLNGHSRGTGAFGPGLSSTTPDSCARAAQITAPATDAARQWAGWGTALKPAAEPVMVARKPLGGTVADAVQAHGTGALHIDACRVEPGTPVTGGDGWASHQTPASNAWDRPYTNGVGQTEPHDAGRWPANVVLSHAPDCADPGPCTPGCPAAELDQQTGLLRSGANPTRRNSDKFSRNTYHHFAGQRDLVPQRGADAGGASRFYPAFRYQAKAPTRERPQVDGVTHPTVKPLELMRWLVRLVTPPDGVVLDPFAGSGTTVEACLTEGVRCVAIEREAAYLPLIQARIDRQTRPATPDDGQDALFAL